MIKHFNICLSAVPLLLVAATATHAQGFSDCDCVLPLQTTGQVQFVRGVVRASSQSGLQPALVGTLLPSGSQLVVGPASAARADFSSACAPDLEANTELSVFELQSQLCVRISSKPIAASVGSSAVFGPYPVIAGYTAFGIWYLTGGDDQVSN